MRLIIILLSISLSFQLSAQLADWLVYDQEGQQLSLDDFMKAKKAPGFSLHIQFDQRDSSFQRGYRDQENRLPVEANTPFAVGSPGIALAKFAILRLVEQNEIQLDEPANTYLKTWQIPTNRITRKAPVTVRDLLLYRRGFGGESKPAGFGEAEQIPSLLQMLKGEAPATNKAVQVSKDVNKKANSEYVNSLILQLLLEDHYQLPFTTIIQKEVLAPLGMTESFYATALSDQQEAIAAVGYLNDGTRLAGDYRRYPELAAAGFWTTAHDYTKFVRQVMDAAKGEDNRFISQDLALEGVKPQHEFRSLLFLVQEDGMIYWGGNAKGFFFSMQANLEEDWIMVGLTNSDLNWPIVAQTLWQGGAWIDMMRKGEQLVVFTQSAEEKKQIATYLPEWKKFCRENRIQLIEKSIEDGLPAEITATPALVYQSPKGRALFGGRLTQISEIENFVRVNRFKPRMGSAEVKENIIFRPEGRFSLAVPLKFTVPSGPSANPVSQSDWEGDFQQILLEEWPEFKRAKSQALQATDRRMYLDVHPYIDESGKLFLSASVFSQFNCIRPIYTNFGQALEGRLDDRDQLFRALAKNVRAVIDQQMNDLSMGDALHPISAKVPAKSWDAIGLALPKRAKERMANLGSTGPLPSDWNTPSPISAGQPMVQFRFPSPLDRYAGTLPTLDGSLSIDEVQKTWSGDFIVDVKSLTMGNSDFDKKVLKSYLQVSKYPSSTFRFKEASLPADWQNRQASVTELDGIFRLKGKDHPVRVRTELIPMVSEGQTPRLQVSVAFQLEIAKTFDLPGPDGPGFARSHLDFDLQFVMQGV